MPTVKRPTPEEREAAEQRARHSIEEKAERQYTDEEWREAKANIKGFFSTLARWQLDAPENATPAAPARQPSHRKPRNLASNNTRLSLLADPTRPR